MKEREKALEKEAARVKAREMSLKREEAKTKEETKKLEEKEASKAKTESKKRSEVENKAKTDEANNSKEAAKFEAAAKEAAKAKTNEQLLALAKAREEGKAEALAIARAEAEAKMKTKEKSKAKNKAKSKAKKAQLQTKIDAEVKKRLAKMPLCDGKGANGKNGTTGKNRVGGTEVFKGKINATDAVGIVGFTNWSINEPPYKVERCDQILLIQGKKLNLKNYCEKEDSFMTMSIYMINFFFKKDVKQLIDSYSMSDITSIPTELPGAPGCTMWTTKTKSFPFCYESKEVLDEITAAYYKFLNCRNPRENDVAYEFKKNCNLAKMNLTAEGPFGEMGPMYKQILESVDPDMFKVKKQDLTGINPYYINGENVRVPGDHIVPPARNPLIANSRFP